VSWSQKKSKISGNVIIDGTVTADNLQESYLRNDQNDSTAYRITAGGLTVDTDTLYVDEANDKVGIGTNTPATQMHIKSGTSSVSALSYTKLFVDSSGSTDIQIGCGYYTTAGIKFGAYNDPDAGRVDYSTYLNALQFYTSGTQKATITSSGTLGLGTTSPSAGIHYRGSSTSGVSPPSNSGLFLESSGSPHIQFGTGQYSSCGIKWGYYGDSDRGALDYVGYNNSMQFRTQGATRMTISSVGYLGIGTTSPTEQLDLSGDTIRIRLTKTPTSGSASGFRGEICYDSNYLYVCVGYNDWKRVALSDF
jgi:hypothetical protein